MQGLQDNSHQVAYHLGTIASLLDYYDLVNDTGPLHDVSGRLLAEPQTDHWHYDLGPLKFTVVGNIAGTIPQGVGLSEIILNINASGYFIDDTKYRDPMSALQINLEINATTEAQSLYAAWHFDKHKGTKGEISNYSHPEYHWTFGGNLMEAANCIYGDCIIFPTPRISYPPMDAVLAIDFVLQNYVALEKRQDLMEAPEYLGAIQNSQLRLWRPYYTALAANWHAFPIIEFDDSLNEHCFNPFIWQSKE